MKFYYKVTIVLEVDAKTAASADAEAEEAMGQLSGDTTSWHVDRGLSSIRMLPAHRKCRRVSRPSA